MRGEYLTRYLLDSDGWDHWQSQILSNAEINNAERATRMWDAVKYGADGSTHAERIQDQREYAENVFRWDRVLPNCLDAVNEYLDSVEDWHHKNGSLHTQVG